MSEKRISITVGAKDEVSPTLEKVGKGLDKLARKSRDAGARGGEPGLMGALDDVKATFGTRGPVKDIAEILIGGGAVAGGTFAIGVLADTVSGLTTAVKGYRDGSLSAADATERFVGSLPIIGRAAISIADMLDALTLEKLPNYRAELELFAEIAKEVAAANREINAVTEGLRFEVEQGKRGPFDQQRAAAEKEFKRDTDKIDKAQEADRDTGFLRAHELAEAQLTAEEKLRQRLAEIDIAEKAARERAEVNHQQQIADIRSRAAAAALRVAGRDREADLELLRRQHERRIEAIDRAERDDLQRLAAPAAEERENVEAEANRMRGEARERLGQRIEEHTAAGDTNAAALIAVLLEKRLEEIDAIAKRKIAEIEGPAGPAAEDVRRRSTEARAAAGVELEAGTAVADAADAERLKRSQDRAAATLRDADINALERQAAAGDRAAESELRRLRVSEEFRQERERIAAILKDEAVTTEQRAQAEAALARLNAGEAAALDRAGQLRRTISPPQLSAGLAESQFLTGIGRRSAEAEQRDEVANRLDQTNRKLDNHDRKFDRMVRFLDGILREMRSDGGGTDIVFDGN